MNESIFLLIPIILPVLCGLALLMMPQPKKRGILIGIVLTGLILTAVFVFAVLRKEDLTFTLFYMTKTLPIYFKVDSIGRLFAVTVTFVWLITGIFSFEYMKHEQKEKRFFGFYLIVYGILTALNFSGNLITFYMFYEFVTLLSMPLVLHTLTHESVMAGLKYVFYSFAGAYMVLFGLYFLSRYGNTLTFTAGGVLDMTLVEGHETLLLTAAFLMLVGFGVKAGMFPLHAWMPAAHSVAPAPASAVLSGIIVKAGVLGIIRVVYYMFGADFIRGTWVQTVWFILTLITILMGSVLAYHEKVLKKRLAYSTISQVSYILFGLALLHPLGVTGALFHVAAHALIKCTLFLTVGAIIYKTGKTNVDEMQGIGRQMPAAMLCYTLVSLALIGIPPTGGFISKWYLGIGALASGLPVFSWLGPVILLVSALLTAGYLLPLTIKGFSPGAEAPSYEKIKLSRIMIVPIIILTIFVIVFGMFPNDLINYLTDITAQIM